MNLIVHADTKRVSEAQVLAVPAGEYTDTFHPMAHSEVINALQTACNNHDIKILNREYSMNEKQTKMFGVWNLNLGNGDMGYSLGLRNAIDKTMAVGVCSGTYVFVCDNLALSGDFIAFRRHTKGLITEELNKIADNALSGAVVEMEKLHNWHKNLHEIWVPKHDRKGLVYDMIDRGVISGGKFDAYHKALEEEKQIRRGKALDGTTTLFAMHGAVTRLLRGENLLRVSKCTGELHKVCDDYIESRMVA